MTRRPVSDIVRDALTVEVSRNGHAVLPDAQDVVLGAEVEEFWLDVVVGRSHAQYVGKVVLALAVVDGRNGERCSPGTTPALNVARPMPTPRTSPAR